MKNKHIICFSGGESSALTAIEVSRKFGIESLILLNHDISSIVEDSDIKRFKNDVAGYIGVPVTYANMSEWFKKDQFDVVVEAGAFKVGTGSALCTSRMKTEPFYRWLKDNGIDESSTIYYGFDAKESIRIQRRASILAAMGYRTGFPLAHWTRTIKSTVDIGIFPPESYNTWRHANCVGCLKAGMQHWYVVYCTRPDIWKRGLWAEEEIGYTIIKDHSLFDLEDKFEVMRRAGVEASEKLVPQTFWKKARELVNIFQEDENMPCECII